VAQQRHAGQQVAVEVGFGFGQFGNLFGGVGVVLVGLLAFEAVRAHQPEVVVSPGQALDVDFHGFAGGQVQEIGQLVGAVPAEGVWAGAPQALDGGALVSAHPQVVAGEQHRGETVAHVLALGVQSELGGKLQSVGLGALGKGKREDA